MQNHTNTLLQVAMDSAKEKTRSGSILGEVSIQNRELIVSPSHSPHCDQFHLHVSRSEGTGAGCQRESPRPGLP
ncbi:hypothetical protein P7K49_040961 [Saguinus oedipus]|uniref:Uncharacterized protein n=1 Tax=Saguinus oedipus TaxID=9490 RepID=A0ABQ9TAD2_SAGOE|nr:hypothetical protein P7K49_040961 [Saguinus oedipus]